MSDKKYRVSEIFYSVQGEGPFTGRPTMWVRFFSCNLNCNGFGQKDPTDPSTYDKQYERIDLTDVTSMEDLPVLTKGCDSAYSWAKRYRHLCPELTAKEIVDQLISKLPIMELSDDGRHPNTGGAIDLCFTGGEPMSFQLAIVDIIEEYKSRFPALEFLNVTIETNTTKKLKEEFVEYFGEHSEVMLTYSMSPKLFSVSGEDNCKALKPDVAVEYLEHGVVNYFKFVVNDTDRAWIEMEQYLADVENLLPAEEDTGAIAYVADYADVFVMPVGATEQDQQAIARAVCERALESGYNFSTRLQNYIFENAVGK